MNPAVFKSNYLVLMIPLKLFVLFVRLVPNSSQSDKNCACIKWTLVAVRVVQLLQHLVVDVSEHACLWNMFKVHCSMHKVQLTASVTFALSFFAVAAEMFVYLFSQRFQHLNTKFAATENKPWTSRRCRPERTHSLGRQDSCLPR